MRRMNETVLAENWIGECCCYWIASWYFEMICNSDADADDHSVVSSVWFCLDSLNSPVCGCTYDFFIKISLEACFFLLIR